MRNRSTSSHTTPGETVRRPHDEKGATASEYALLISAIVLIIVGGVGVLGGNIDDYYRALAEGVAAALP